MRPELGFNSAVLGWRCRGVVLLNAAGRFDEDGAEEGAAVATEEQQSLWSRVAEQGGGRPPALA